MRFPAAFLVVTTLCSAVFGADAPVDYVREVKPIFSQNCYRCHGASQQKAKLRMDTAAAAKKGGETGAGFVPGKSAESLIVQAVKGTHADISRMPYKKPPLAAAQIALIERWIDQGANAPSDEQPEAKIHWAFVPPGHVVPPAIKQSSWSRNGIDNFIFARLEKESIKPSPEADKVTLIRRVSLDLTGLPPSAGDVEAFVKDNRADAYERLVERLIASPHFGERWGRLWLDAARYADSNGYSIDAPRSIWKYREWVINALNQDLPFNEFVVDQLAGDLLPKPTVSQKIATGFNRNTQINQEGGIDPEQFRIESVMDRVSTTANAFLGITLGCAQCHDHKFDPLTQKDYYQFFAFFNNTVEDGHGKAAPDGVLEIPNEFEAMDAAIKELEEAEEDLDRYLNGKGSEVVKWRESMTPEQEGKLKPDVREALKIAYKDLTPKQKRAVYAAFRSDDNEFKTRNTRLVRLERRQPKPITTLVMVEKNKPRESHVFIKGDFTRPDAQVFPGIPAIFDADKKDAATNETRLDLAKWIASQDNPLAGRVIVNRIWQQYFGRGIVETENDFGTQGSPPSHPELLDWLARQLVNSPTNQQAHGWSLKNIHRLIVTSATYRQSSRARPDLSVTDPNNRLLARQSRLRLDAEVVRDVCLTVSGKLNDKIGGPSVFPPQPNGVMNLGQSKRTWTASTGADRYRRGLYTFFWRATPFPALMVFDSADAFSACTRRLRSNTPLQALTLLNDEGFNEFAQAFAARVLSNDKKPDPALIDWAFSICLSRTPSLDEHQRLLALYQKEFAAAEAKEFKEKRLVAWNSVARVLLNLDETITRE